MAELTMIKNTDIDAISSTDCKFWRSNRCRSVYLLLDLHSMYGDIDASIMMMQVRISMINKITIVHQIPDIKRTFDYIL
jgi:hypothetical protein